jgi:DNA-binding GntR family transcriptional regulator
VVDLQISLQRDSPVPLYFQIATQLGDAVRDGRLGKGQFLKNELDLAVDWQVSRPTARRAIQELVDDGLLVRRRGVGTQVVNDRVRRPVRLSSLYDDLLEQGRAPSTEITVHKRVKATREVADALGVPVGTPVVFIERCRSAGTTKLAILRNWLLVEAAGEFTTGQLASSGLYNLLRAVGVRPKFATQRLGAVAASTADAKLLNLRVGSALVTMRRVMQDDTGRTVELGLHVYDAAQYSVEMTVTES